MSTRPWPPRSDNSGLGEGPGHPNGVAPTGLTLHGGRKISLGGKGGRLAQAWQHVWDQLDRKTWTSSSALAEEAAEKFDLKPVSVTEMLCRMRATGVLEQKMVILPTTYHRGGKDIIMNRPRVHYRIAAGK